MVVEYQRVTDNAGLCMEGPALDPFADDEVVDQEADPAGGEDGDGQDDLPEEVELGLLENVDNTPDGGDDTDDVDNAC